MQLLLQLYANIHDLVYLLIHMRRQIYIQRKVSTSRIAGTHPKGEPLWGTAAYQQKLTQLIPFGVHNEACRTEQPLNCGRSSWRRKVPKWRTQLKIKQHSTLQNLLASATRAVPAGPFASKPGAWSSHHLEKVFNCSSIQFILEAGAFLKVRVEQPIYKILDLCSCFNSNSLP